MNTSVNVRTVKKQLPKRERPYRHREGKFTLTASFRDKDVDWTTVQLVAALIGHATQKQLAIVFRCSTSTIGKLVRIAAANSMLPKSVTEADRQVAEDPRA